MPEDNPTKTGHDRSRVPFASNPPGQAAAQCAVESDLTWVLSPMVPVADEVS
jgi:hypothetical protein